MSQIRQRRLFADPNPNVTSWEWYVTVDTAVDAFDRVAWLAAVDAGTETPFSVTDVPETFLDETTGLEGEFTFAVVQVEASGNKSDPATTGVWTEVPLDVTPPAAATGLGIEVV